MGFIHYITRKDNVVNLEIDSGLGTCKPIYIFVFNAGSQEYAELLKNHLEKKLYEWKMEICKQPEMWLEPHQISELKAKLKNWHGGKHCWI
ncbi:MAG: hypothetical protein ACYS80_20925 [Planctomycetota bacterium]|jgi:hypothetical protein